MAAILPLTLLSWPAFLYGVGLLFWCFQLSSLTFFTHFWKLGRRNDVEGVLRFLKAGFQYKLVKVGKEELHTGNCVYLVNHRSWADFFVDMYVIGARAVPLGRRAVGIAFPAFSCSLMAVKSVLLFHREGVRDKEKFNVWIDASLAAAHASSLLVYPEGTRSLKSSSLPLKRGMLRYAHSRNLPVQIVITAHKEEVMNEKVHCMHFGRTLVTGFSEVLESSKHEDFEEFMKVVQAAWNAEWERVHAAPRKGLPELKPSFPTIQYTTTELALQSTSLGFWGLVLLWMIYQACKTLLAVAASGTVGYWLVCALGLYVAASFVVAWFPPKASSAKRTKKQE